MKSLSSHIHHTKTVATTQLQTVFWKYGFLLDLALDLHVPKFETITRRRCLIRHARNKGNACRHFSQFAKEFSCESNRDRGKAQVNFVYFEILISHRVYNFENLIHIEFTIFHNTIKKHHHCDQIFGR